MVNEVRAARLVRASRSGGSSIQTIAPGGSDDQSAHQWFANFEQTFKDFPQAPARPAEFAVPALPSITLESGPVVFGGGVPVGGWSNLSLYPNGWFSAVGHFHDSGAPSYDILFTWSVWSPRHGLIIVAHKGHMAGTFESGSRDHDWSIQQYRADIAAEWPNLSNGYSWQWNAHVNMDLGAVVDSIKNAIQAAVQIAQVILIFV
jgi:hypothetical protein